MPNQPSPNDPFAVDLLHGVVPISRTASALAALIKHSRAKGQPIIITQKGTPSGVLLALEVFEELRQRVDPTRRPQVRDEEEVASDEGPSDE
ncbi:MAG: type II toxin-antitoxin system Phd/YefM family antitoxin [Candidatus Viridilinea halotolerans]|uniref:Type II toxin-antitoxin system Phd/YefM family antitoxin n=1 Tax=Candidatus Viridilinea halotolerans TaxID=2491704 RepID=A0A426TRT5_9CHLR|nr:MAG: type II toxin-antitoxin system Phd/YefM family antitoxin [Candidatus Viridilinea halotolerans]